MGPQELGRQLRRARQHRGLSLRDVHAITAIPLPCLAALEEGDLGQLPSPVYARGYVRSYAEAVRLDGDRLALELWRTLEEPKVTAPAGARAPSRSTPSAAPKKPDAKPRTPSGPPATSQPSSLAALRQPKSPWVPKDRRIPKPHAPRIFRPNAGRMMRKSRRSTRGPGRWSRAVPALERVAIVALVLVLAAGIWDLQRGTPSKTSKVSAKAAGVATPEPKSTPSTAPVTTPPPPPPAPPVGAAPVADTGSQATYSIGRDHFVVAVQATDAPLWIQVRAAARGPVVFMGTLQPGESKPFDAPGVLFVRVGNLGHTAVQVDGAPLTLPPKPSVPYNFLLQK